MPSTLVPFPLPTHLPLQVGAYVFQLGGLGERSKLPQWGLERCPCSQNLFWCILALQSDIWWQQLN